MKNEVKILELQANQNDPQSIEDIINDWVNKGWTFKQLATFANKVYVVLEMTVAQ